ncbi:MAG: hypothetical protein NTV55_07265 [Planctomycetota bacterium]|nr:hypothetical protein [Planctomycetota bacterium]
MEPEGLSAEKKRCGKPVAITIITEMASIKKETSHQFRKGCIF